MSAGVLVLGVGNPLLGDEGLGPRVIAELDRLYRFPSEVRLLDGGTGGLSLLAEVTAVEKLLVVDALRTGADPGKVVSLEGDSLRAAYRSVVGPHDIGVGELLAAARFHGGPKEIVLFGIEPETLELRVGLSATMSNALPKLVAEVMKQLDRWGVAGWLRSDGVASAESRNHGRWSRRV